MVCLWNLHRVNRHPRIAALLQGAEHCTGDIRNPAGIFGREACTAETQYYCSNVLVLCLVHRTVVRLVKSDMMAASGEREFYKTTRSSTVFGTGANLRYEMMEETR